MKVYFRVGLFSCQCCKLLFANKRSSEPRTKPLTSEGTERFNMNPATPLPATSIAHGYVTQKSYIAFPFLSSLLMLLLSFEDNTTSVLALIEVTFLVLFLFALLVIRGCCCCCCPPRVSSTGRNERETKDDETRTTPMRD